MILLFLRHTEAEDSSPAGDCGRRLTEKGTRRARQAGKALAALGLAPGLILTSPLTRALQTAELVAESLGTAVAVETRLAGGLDLDDLAEIVAENADCTMLMLVGHEPDFSYVVGRLIGSAAVEMKKGAVACVDVQGVGRGSGLLRWLLTGRQMELMA